MTRGSSLVNKQILVTRPPVHQESVEVSWIDLKYREIYFRDIFIFLLCCCVCGGGGDCWEDLIKW